MPFSFAAARCAWGGSVEAARQVTPAMQKTLQLSPITAIAAAAGIFALGMLVMNALSLR